MSPIFIPLLGIRIRWSLVTICSHPFNQTMAVSRDSCLKRDSEVGQKGSRQIYLRGRILQIWWSEQITSSGRAKVCLALQACTSLFITIHSCLLPDPLQQYHSHFHTQKQSHGTLKFALHVSDRWLSTGKVEKLDLGQLPWPCLVVNPCRRQSFRLQHSWAQPHPRESGKQLIQ